MKLCHLLLQGPPGERGAEGGRGMPGEDAVAGAEGPPGAKVGSSKSYTQTSMSLWKW